MIKWIVDKLAWIQIHIWGFCPECNSDAPKLYDCEVCIYDTTSPFGRKKRVKYWKKYLELHKDDKQEAKDTGPDK